MQYLVDGYNLLFKEAWARSSSSLEGARKALIKELDLLASQLNLSITVVFDAPFQSEELKRGHFNSLEIIFTARGQTADDYLVEATRHLGKKAHVVTSDRGLRARVKAMHAEVEGVHEFLVHLRKKSRNKLAKSQQKPLIAKKEVAVPVKVEPLQDVVVDMKNLPSLGDLNAWERIFLKRTKDEGPKGRRT